MAGSERRAFLVGVVGAIAVFVALFYAVGGRRVLDALAAAEPGFVAVTFAAGLCWLFAWSLMLRTVLATLGVNVPVGKSFLVYAGAVFANNVTPFGQAGGEPVAALLISKVSDARYETGLAGIASVDVLNVVPSISLVFVCVGYYATTTAVAERVQTAVASAVGVIVAISVLLALAWRYRRPLADRTSGAIARLARALRIDRREPAVLERAVRTRLTHFFDHVELVATSPRRLAIVLGFSLLGWLFQGAALLAAFAAVGHAVPIYVLLFVIPLGNLAGAAPLPGGLGGIETAFVVLLVATTSVAAPAVTAAVLIYRGAIYWMPVAIGAGSSTAFGVRRFA